MTEITRVPLQPIKKGSLTKLWLGVLAVILLGAGMAWAALPKTLSVETLTEGTGKAPEMGDIVFLNYVGTLPDGTEFDRSREAPLPAPLFPQGTPFPLEEGGLIPGFIDGLLQTREGGKYRIEIPADQAYGANPQPGSDIPPNSDLVFEVEVVGVMSRQDAEARLMQLRAMMGGPGGPEGQPAPQE